MFLHKKDLYQHNNGRVTWGLLCWGTRARKETRKMLELFHPKWMVYDKFGVVEDQVGMMLAKTDQRRKGKIGEIVRKHWKEKPTK